MISAAEARAIVVSHAKPLAAENVALDLCLGRTLAAPVLASRPQPPFDASAMDGFAVASADTPGSLMLAGEAGAGRPFRGVLSSGQCVRIFTGAPVPDGADAIVTQEDATKDGVRVTVPKAVVGRHIRPAGGDFDVGAELLPRGVTLDAVGLTAAAAAGKAALSLAVRPRITVLAGGDEIVAPGAAISDSQIFECVSFGVNGLATAWGARSARGPMLRDDAAFIASAMQNALQESDLVVIIGGASVGDHDHARAAARAVGGELLFEKVALIPGKPTWFARCADRAILGLPGNPASALVTARLFLRPMLAAMLGGDPERTVQMQCAQLAAPLGANGPREAYLRASTHVGQDARVCVMPAAKQDSSLVSVFAASDVLIVRAPHAPPLDAGALVDTLRI